MSPSIKYNRPYGKTDFFMELFGARIHILSGIGCINCLTQLIFIPNPPCKNFPDPLAPIFPAQPVAPSLGQNTKITLQQTKYQQGSNQLILSLRPCTFIRSQRCEFSTVSKVFRCSEKFGTPSVRFFQNRGWCYSLCSLQQTLKAETVSNLTNAVV